MTCCTLGSRTRFSRPSFSCSSSASFASPTSPTSPTSPGASFKWGSCGSLGRGAHDEKNVRSPSAETRGAVKKSSFATIRYARRRSASRVVETPRIGTFLYTRSDALRSPQNLILDPWNHDASLHLDRPRYQGCPPSRRGGNPRRARRRARGRYRGDRRGPHRRGGGRD